MAEEYNIMRYEVSNFARKVRQYFIDYLVEYMALGIRKQT